MDNISFKELVMALKREKGRKIVANYGLDPRLGKYHATEEGAMGVFERIDFIKDKKETVSPEHRPPYIYQIPLTFIPGLGGKTINKLLDHFGNEMNILHKISKDDIEAVTNEKIADLIIKAREGKLDITAGGGGTYGKINTK